MLIVLLSKSTRIPGDNISSILMNEPGGASVGVR